jgi:DNA-binding PadR family transcriptional regulator
MYGRHGFGFGGRFGRGFGCEPPRMRRGDMKFLLLEILKEGPRHGYEIITGLEGRFRGYRPSPGSVYPTLQMLEEGGYVTSEEIDAKKVYTITDTGLKLLEERGESKFQETPGMKQAWEIKTSLAKLGMAVIDGVRGSDPETVKKIEEILNKARKEVYSVLAES